MAKTPTETVLITGAGAGIGRELLRRFLADGAQVIAVSLLQTELDEVAREHADQAARLHTLAMDMSAAGASQTLLDWCQDKGFEVDVLVNNAGFGCYGETVDLDAERLRAMLALNVVALTESSHLFARRMKARGRGSILNMGSTAGMVPAPRLAAYCASKSYVNSFSYALRAELAPFGVNVTCLTPGLVQTKFGQGPGFKESAAKSMVAGTYASGKATSVHTVADAAYHGLRKGRAQVLVGKGSFMAAIACRLFSQPMLPRLAGGV